MTHFKSFTSRVGVLTAVLLWAVSATGQNTTVLIDPVNVRQQGTISFAEFPAGQVPNLFQDVDPVSADTDDHQYRIIVDLKSIKPGRFGTFNADLYVQPTNLPNAELSKFILTGTPVGGFLDSNDYVSVHVLRSGRNSKGSVAIPLHNTGQVDLISTDVPILLRDVSLGQVGNSEFKFTNKLENLRLDITDIKVEPECPKCWKRTIQPAPLEAGENQTFVIPVTLEASTFSALWASALKLKSDQSHDNLSFTITYHAGFGGQTRTQHFTFPLRFTPSFWALILAVMIGLVLGFITSLFLDKEKRSSRDTILKAFGVALGLSVVVEILALALAASGSKVVVFGFDLDPRQFLPAMVIAILVSGGASVVAAVKSAFGMGGGG